MDSANSSSMQSSSGGDEEYDSRADHSLSALLDHHHHHLAGVPPPLPPQNHHHLHEQLHFDNSLLSNFFEHNTLSSSYDFLTRNPTSGPDPTTSQPRFPATSSLPRPPPPPPLLPLPQTHHGNINSNNNGNSNMGVVKKSKKRSRASRRAPTTVLTTDTSNFRAMVQEFTGIPSPPLFANTRLNTFLGLSPSPSSSSSYNLLLRPFAQKLVPTSPLISSLQSPSSESVLMTPINSNQLHHGSSSSLPSSSGNVFQNLQSQSLLQVPVPITNPRSDHNDVIKTNVFAEEFGLGGLQRTDPPLMSTNRDEDHGDHGDSDHRKDNPMRLRTENGDDKGMENPTASRNEGTVESWLCSSSH